MGPHVETKESAAPALLVLSTDSILVRITLCGVDTPGDGMTAHLTRATWGARCGKSARRVLRGGTGTSDLVARLVPTHHSIPHAELLKSVARWVVDGAMLHLIKMWLGSSGGRNRRVRKETSEYAQSGRRSGHASGGSDHAPYTKGNFQFERIITGWRTRYPVLDRRLKR
jgi:hypothetical protein